MSEKPQENIDYVGLKNRLSKLTSDAVSEIERTLEVAPENKLWTAMREIYLENSEDLQTLGMIAESIDEYTLRLYAKDQPQCQRWKAMALQHVIIGSH